MDTFATTVSVALQYGVPLRDLVNKFAHVRFEPSGFTGNQEIPIAKSIVDYIFRWLGSRFLGPEDKAMLGLIDRSAVVSEPPSYGGSSFGGGFGAASSALAPAAEEGLSSIDEAVSNGGGSSSAPTQAKSDPPADAPKATAVADEPAVSEAPKAHEPLAVIASNGHANGHTTNGNGGGKPAAITLSLGATNVAFKIQEDAPSCAECGSIMVRNGSCYKCLNCGSTSGCS
jgi:ribonucleoside-diphosphate reductase alpha chain